jgi:hypothetical protein
MDLAETGSPLRKRTRLGRRSKPPPPLPPSGDLAGGAHLLDLLARLPSLGVCPGHDRPRGGGFRPSRLVVVLTASSALPRESKDG